jgi:hypothetical protein
MEPNADGSIPEGAEGVLPPSPEGEGAPAAAPAVSEPEFNAQDFILNYKGQPITPKDRQQLLNWGQQGYDYSQKMAQFKQDRETWERDKQNLEQYRVLDERFQKEPDLAKGIRDFVQKYEAGQIEGIDPDKAKIFQELESIKNERVVEKQEKQDRLLQEEIDKVKGEYSHYDWKTDNGEGTLEKQIIKHALDNKIDNIRAAFRDFVFDKEKLNAQANALRTAKEQRQEQLRQGKVQSGRTTPPAPAGGTDTSKSYHEIGDQIEAELRSKT